MKNYLIILSAGMLTFAASCASVEQENDTSALESRIDSLEAEIAELKTELAPGLAVLMNQNYDHLKKLEVAINEGNWEYADFCLHEMDETFEQIVDLHNNHDELVQPADTQFKAFIFPTFEQLEEKVDTKDQAGASQLFIELKTNCSKCHTANNHGFIRL
ncbi:MAG: hypothetical protein H6548_09810 [Chitinophagales bacterium]|nr:hypothetical protein [Chitinophagales bacterium]MCB9022404.1 hypothetical protein [Chitinophagales bacterium]